MAQGLSRGDVPVLDRMLTFRARLLLLAAAVLIPFSLLTAWALHGAVQRGLDDARQSSLNLARLIAAHYGQFLRDSESLLQELARRPDIRAMDAAHCDAQLKETHSLLPMLTTLVVIQPDGRMPCSSLPLPQDRPVSLRELPWFEEMMAAPGLHVSEPMIGPISALWTAAVTYPIHDADGIAVGRIGFGVRLDRFQELMEGQVQPEGAVLTLISEGGALLARLPPLPERIGERFDEFEIVKRSAREREGTAEARGIDGLERVYGFARVARSGWNVHAGIPREMALTAAYFGMRQVAVGYLLTVALLMLLLALFYRGMTRSVDALRAATGWARQHGGRVRGEPLPETGPRELREAISAFNRLFEELRQSDERFRLICRATSDVVWDWNLSDNTRWWNENFRTAFGYPRDMIEPGIESWTSRMHPDDAERVKESIYGVIHGGGTQWQDEYRFRRLDGRYARIFDRGLVLRDSGGKALRMVGVMEDITDRKVAEEDLRNVFEMTPDVIFVADFSGLLLRISPAASRISGYTDEEMRQRTFLYFIHPDDRAAMLAEIERVRKEGVTRAFTVRFRTRDGSYRWMEGSAAARPGENRIYAVARDVTERRLIEARLQRQATELACANDELQRFARAAAHDLQEPLRAVASYTQLLTRRYADAGGPETRQYAEYITSAVHRLHELIDALRKYVEVPPDWMASLVPTDLNAVLEGVLADLDQPISAAGVTVVRGALPTVSASPSQMAQAFHHLLDNAIKFRGGVPLRIEIGAHQQEAEWIVSVRDNGAGLDAGQVEQIFEVLKGRPVNGGVLPRGIGLAMCRRIIEHHGGRIWVEPGDPGSVFRFSLPVGG
jgi:PAS domain S-box-containing protein